MVALLAAGLVYLISKDDGKHSGQTAPPGNEEALGLLPASALDGSGWTSPGTVELTSLPLGIVAQVVPAAPECASLQSLEEQLFLRNGAFASGRLRKYDGEGGRAVTHLRVQFTESVAAEALLQRIGEALEASALAACLEAVARRDGSDVTASETGIIGLPDGAVGRAVQLSVNDSNRGLISQTLVWWAEGATLSALSMVSVGGSPPAQEVLRLLEAAMAATRKVAPE